MGLVIVNHVTLVILSAFYRSQSHEQLKIKLDNLCHRYEVRTKEDTLHSFDGKESPWGKSDNLCDYDCKGGVLRFKQTQI